MTKNKSLIKVKWFLLGLNQHVSGLFAQFNLIIVVLFEFPLADIFNFYFSYIHSWVIMILKDYKGLELKTVILEISEHRMFKCRHHLHLILCLSVPLFCLTVKRSTLWRGWKNNEWNITGTGKKRQAIKRILSYSFAMSVNIQSL